MSKQNSQKKETHQKNKKKTIIVVVASLVAFSAVAGASGKNLGNTPIEETANDQLSEKSGQQYTMRTDDAAFSTGAENIPDLFTANNLLYPQSEIKNTVTAKESDAIVLMSGDSLTQVTDYYNQRLPQSGFTVTSTTSLENANILSIEKGDATGAVIINMTEQGTQITIDIGKDEALE